MTTKMFANYANDQHPGPILPRCKGDFLSNLSSDKNVSIAYDVFGDEIGVKAAYKKAFELYFYLTNLDPTCDLQQTVQGSDVIFEVYSANHVLTLHKVFSGNDVFDCDTNCLKVSVSEQDAANFEKDSYRIRLTLSWPGGSYELYPESAGLLIVR